MPDDKYPDPGTEAFDDLTSLEQVAAVREAEEEAAERQQAVERGVPPDPDDRTALDQQIAEGDLEQGRAEVVDQGGEGEAVETVSVDTNERVTDSGDVELKEGIANEGDFSPDPNIIRDRETQAQAESGAADLREQSGRDDIQADDVTVVQEDGQAERVETNQSFQEEQAAESVRERTGADVTEEQIRPTTDGELRLSDAGRQAIRKQRQRDASSTDSPRGSTGTNTAAATRDAVTDFAETAAGAGAAVSNVAADLFDGDGRSETDTSTRRRVGTVPAGGITPGATDAGERVVEAIVGPPGAVEGFAADVGAGVADVSGDAADTVAPLVGEVAEAPIQFSEQVTGAVFGAEAAEEVTPGAADAAEAGVESFGESASREIIGLPEALAQGAALGKDVGVFATEQVEEEGVIEGLQTTGEAGAAVGSALAAEAGQQVVQSPFRSVGTVGGILAGGVGAASVLERASTAARVRAATRGGPRVDLGDVSTEGATRGDLPEFETSPDAPTREAVDEVRDRASDAPDELQEAAGDEQILFRSETERLDRGLDVGRGNFELPGLFASPDLSPLRLDIGREISLSDLRPRAPRVFGRPQRTSAFEAPDVEGMPGDAAGSGRIVDPGTGETIPDPDTPGAQFLDETADEGTAFVRATGDRTTELEAIFPPGSEFVRSTTGRLDVPGGRDATLDVFRQVDDAADDVAAAGDDAADIVGDADETFTAQEVLERSRGDTPTGTPVSPTVLTGSRTVAGGGSDTGGVFGRGPGETGATGTSPRPALDSETASTTSGSAGSGSRTSPTVGEVLAADFESFRSDLDLFGDSTFAVTSSRAPRDGASETVAPASVSEQTGDTGSGTSGAGSEDRGGLSVPIEERSSPGDPSEPGGTPGSGSPGSPGDSSSVPPSSLTPPSGPPSIGSPGSPPGGSSVPPSLLTPPSDPPSRPPRDGADDDGRSVTDLFSDPDQRQAAGDDGLESGWFNQYVVAFATQGGGDRSAPDQDTLEEQPLADQLVGALPTEAQISGSEETQERIEEVFDLFSGESVNVDVDENKGTDDSSEDLGLLAFGGDSTEGGGEWFSSSENNGGWF